MDNGEKIFSICGGLVSNRVYPDIAPQDKLPTYPFIVYSLLSVNIENTNCGNLMTSETYQVDLYSLSARDRNAKGAELIGRLKDNGISIVAYRHDFMDATRSYRVSIDIEMNKEQ